MKRSLSYPDQVEYPDQVKYLHVMRNWPAEALRYHPELASADIYLRGGRLRSQVPSTSRDYLDLWQSGGKYAITFKLRTKKGEDRILKLFKIEDPNALQRYQRISEFLRTSPIDLTQYFLHFTYEPARDDPRNPSGFVVDPARPVPLPFVTMEFSPGQSLRRFVRETVASRRHDMLERLTDEWQKLTQALRRAAIAHGDLSSANILVQRDSSGAPQIKLVDYDGIFVPALRGLPAANVGVESYNHPGRTLEHFDERMDDFSALLINLSLRALALDRSLAVCGDEVDEYALLIPFTEIAGRGGPLLGRLSRSSDPEIARSAELVLRALRAPYGSVPIGDPVTLAVAELERTVELERREGGVPEAVVRAASDSYLHGHSVLLRYAADISAARDWAPRVSKLVPLLESAERLNSDLADKAALDHWKVQDLVTYPKARRFSKTIQLIEQRLGQWQALERALARGDDEKVAAVWNSASGALAAYEPVERNRQRVAEAIRRGELRRDAIRQLVDAINADDDLRIDDAAHTPVLAGHAVLAKHSSRIATARVWAPKIRPILGLIDDPAQDAQVIALWDSSRLAGHPPARPLGQRVELLRTRLVAWGLVEAGLAAGEDSAVARHWDPQLFAGYPPVEGRREEIELSARRARIVSELEHALAADAHADIEALLSESQGTALKPSSSLELALLKHRIHLAHEALLARAVQQGSVWATLALAQGESCASRPAATVSKIQEAHARIELSPELVGALALGVPALVAQGLEDAPGSAVADAADLLQRRRVALDFRRSFKSDVQLSALAQLWRSVERAGARDLLTAKEIDLGVRAVRADEMSRLLESMPTPELLERARVLAVPIGTNSLSAVRRGEWSKRRGRVLAAALLRASPPVIARAAAKARVEGAADRSTERTVRRARSILGRALRRSLAEGIRSKEPSAPT